MICLERAARPNRRLRRRAAGRPALHRAHVGSTGASTTCSAARSLPIDGVEPGNLRIDELLRRVERDHIEEVVLAHQPDHDGRGDGGATSPTGCATAHASRGWPAACRSAATSSTPTRSRSAGLSRAAARSAPGGDRGELRVRVGAAARTRTDLVGGGLHGSRTSLGSRPIPKTVSFSHAAEIVALRRPRRGRDRPYATQPAAGCRRATARARAGPARARTADRLESARPRPPSRHGGPRPRHSCGCCRCRRAGRRPPPRCGWARRPRPPGARQDGLAAATVTRQAYDRRRSSRAPRASGSARTKSAGRRPRPRPRSGARCRRAHFSADVRIAMVEIGVEPRRPPAEAERLQESLLSARNDHQSMSSPSQERRSRRSVPAGGDPDPIVVSQHLVDIRGQTRASTARRAAKRCRRRTAARRSRSRADPGCRDSPRLRAGRPGGSGRQTAIRSPGRAP